MRTLTWSIIPQTYSMHLPSRSFDPYGTNSEASIYKNPRTKDL